MATNKKYTYINKTPKYCGFVLLIYKNGIDRKQFNCLAERSKAINKWKKLYGKKFNDAIIKDE